MPGRSPHAHHGNPLDDTWDWEADSSGTDFKLKIPHGEDGSRKAVPRPDTERRLRAETPFDSEIHTEQGSDRVSLSVSFLFRILGWAFDGVLGITEGSRIVYSDRSFQRLTGYSYTELRGQHLRILIPHRFRDAHDEYVDQFFRSGQTFTDIGGRSSDSPLNITAVNAQGNEIELTAFLFKLNRGRRHRAFALLRRTKGESIKPADAEKTGRRSDMIQRAGEVLVRLLKTANEHRAGAAFLLLGGLMWGVYALPVEKLQTIADIATGHRPLIEQKDSKISRVALVDGTTIDVPAQFAKWVQLQRQKEEVKALQTPP